MTRAKTVLVVDDNNDFIKFTTIVLENEGYRVVAARDGEEALQKLQEMRPDLIIIDIIMPRKNGYQLCRAIKEDELLKTLPVLFFSAKSEPSDRFWAKRLGADAFLPKPRNASELVREVTALLQRSQITSG